MAIHSDSFEILRNCRALFIKHLGALLQDSQLISGHAITAIQEGAGAYFDEVIATNKRGSFAEEVDGLTASRITLLAEDDLELGIRLDNLTARLFDNSGDALWKLHLRFVTLLRRPELPKSDNPVGPKSICRGLDNLFAAAGTGSLDEKLTLLDQFETYLRQNLPALYAELNTFLETAGIDAAQPAIITSPDSSTHAKVAAPAVTGNALENLQQLLAARLPSLPEAHQQNAGGAAASLLNQSALEQLMFRLEALERMGRFGPPVVPGSAPSAEPMMPALFSDNSAPDTPKIIRSSELGIPKTATESLAIDTLAMIFEAIFADPALPDSLKAIISSLQIKLLKVAMKDSTLFTDPEHPARQVLDGMAEATLGLPLDVSTRHPVCVRLFELASNLRLEAGIDKAGFVTTQDQIKALVDSRNGQIAAEAECYRTLFDQIDQNERVATEVKQTIRAARQQKPPEAVSHFLESTWHQVLLQVGRESGPGSPQWQEFTGAIDGLLWSFQPKTAAEERKLLAQRVPLMLKTLKAGMERVGLPAKEQETFLDECFRLQTQALRSAPGQAAASENTGELPADFPKITTEHATLERLQSGDLVLLTLDMPGSSSPRTTSYALGDWLAVRVAEGDIRIGQVCHIAPDSRRTLLCNPENGFALAIHPTLLEHQLRDGHAEIRSGQSLFDRAASRALGQAATNRPAS